MNSMNLSSRTIVIIAVVGVLLIAGGFIFAQAVPLLFPPEASAEATETPAADEAPEAGDEAQ